MPDERRERYEAAISSKLPDELCSDGLADVTDAAMAMADEEITEALRISDAATAAMLEERSSENARLRTELEQARVRVQAITEATVVWRDRPSGDVGLAIALAGILDMEKPEPPASAALVRILAECDRIEREVHGQPDEDDDGMCEAIRRIRAAAGAEQAGHAYLSTGCLHGEHGYCQAHTGLSGAKTPGQCKFCGAKCQCPCHGSTTAKEA